MACVRVAALGSIVLAMTEYTEHLFFSIYYKSRTLDQNTAYYVDGRASYAIETPASWRRSTANFQSGPHLGWLRSGCGVIIFFTPAWMSALEQSVHG